MKTFPKTNKLVRYEDDEFTNRKREEKTKEEEKEKNVGCSNIYISNPKVCLEESFSGSHYWR